MVDQYNVPSLDGLRTVDATIFPAIVRADTNATGVLTGEPADDLIRDG